MSEYQEWRGSFRQYPDQAAVAEAFEAHLAYQPQVSSPWCNTLLVNSRSLNYRMTYVPAGIGLSFYGSPAVVTFPVKSHYLFLKDEEYRMMRRLLRVEQLAETPNGTLYRNLDAGCR